MDNKKEEKKEEKLLYIYSKKTQANKYWGHKIL